MRQLRKIIFWCHLPLGLVGGVVILIMSVTGVLLTYEKQAVSWVDANQLRPQVNPKTNSLAMPMQTLIQLAREHRQQMPTAIIAHEDPNYPIEFSFGREASLFLDRQTGQVVGEGSQGVRKFFRVVTDWHRWLGAQGQNREVARAVTGACNLAFLGLVVSGLYLWWPRKWSFNSLRNSLWFKPTLKGKARDFNWHNVIGFWSAIPLFIVVVSGVVISYAWAGNLVYRAVGETPPKPRSPQSQPQLKAEPQTLSGLDQAFATAQQQVKGWRTVTFSLPAKDGEWLFSIDRGTGGQPQRRSQVVIEHETGAVIRSESFSDNSPGRRLRSVLRFAHTGEVLGIAGQTIAGIASAGSVFLVWTGFALAWRRFRGWLKAKSPVISSNDVVTNQFEHSQS